MGIQDRDYYRDGSDSFFRSWKRQGVIVWIIAVTTVGFFAQCYPTGRPDGFLFQAGMYSFRKVEGGEVWRLLTPLFLHVSLIHLLFNMLVLYWAGTKIEQLFGSRTTLAFYLTSGVLANGINFLAESLNAFPPSTAVGASGAVTAVFVVFALNFPRSRWLLLFIPVPAWLLLIIYLAIDTLGVLGIGRAGIGYLVHLGGALCGLLFFLATFPAAVRSRLGRLAPKPADRARLRLQQVAPEEVDEPESSGTKNTERSPEGPVEHLEANLDRILEKVSKHGRESLTEGEQHVLVKASEIYKMRRR
jgi:membrane associated rhomboid family serine protease